MLRRKIKNTVKQYSQSEVLVRESTSNDPWGPTSSQLVELCDLTYSTMLLQEIICMLYKRLNDNQKNWRHVYKSLLVIDYLIKTGHPSVYQRCKSRMPQIETLCDFNYFEEHRDVGVNVREKAKQVLELFKNEEWYMEERKKALAAKEKFENNPTALGSDVATQYGLGKNRRREQIGTDKSKDSESTPELSREDLDNGESEKKVPIGKDDEDAADLEIALRMSKEEYEKELSHRQSKELREEAKLRLAMEESLKDDCTVSNPEENNEQKVEVDKIEKLLDFDPWMTESKVDADFGGNNFCAVDDLSDLQIENNNLDAWGGTLSRDLQTPINNEQVPAETETLKTVSENLEFEELNSPTQSSISKNTTGQPFLDDNGFNAEVMGQKENSVKSFLAKNSGLVDLDNIVSIPKEAMASRSTMHNNPFVARGLCDSPKVSLNEMCFADLGNRMRFNAVMRPPFSGSSNYMNNQDLFASMTVPTTGGGLNNGPDNGTTVLLSGSNEANCNPFL